MQYKIPFFINYFVGVFEIFLQKNDISKEIINQIDSMEIANYFENGNLDEEHQKMYDFGLPLELVNIIKNGKVIISEYLKEENKVLDEYEKVMLNEYLNITK